MDVVPPSQGVDEGKPSPTEEPVQDDYYFLHCVCFLLGVGALLPWFAIVTSIEYFMLIFPGSSVEFNAILVYCLSAVVTYPVLIFTQGRIPFGPQIALPFFCFILIMLTMAGFFHLQLWMFLLLVLVIGIMDAILQVSMNAFALVLSPTHSGLVQLGMGLSGIIISALKIMTKLSLPGDDRGTRDSSRIFLLCGAGLSLICFLLVLAALKTKFAIIRLEDYYNQMHLQAKNGGLIETQPPQEDSTPREQPPKSASSSSSSSESFEDPEGDDHIELEEPGKDTNPHSAPPEEEQTPTCSLMKTEFCRVQGKIYPFAIFLFINFILTLAVFPGLTVQLKGDIPALQLVGWYSVLLITIFNIFDALGRFLTMFSLFHSMRRSIMYFLILSRYLIIIFFVLSLKPLLLITKAWVHVPVIAYFALINGMSVGYFFQNVASEVEFHERGTASTVLCLAIQIGLFVGSFVGFGVGLAF